VWSDLADRHEQNLGGSGREPGLPGVRDRLSHTGDHHPEGNSYIERFHRSLKEEEAWTAEYRNLEGARDSIAGWIAEHNHERPHCGVQNRTPQEAFLAFAVDLKNEALTV
jgi:transposase InsO family protein